MNLRLCCPQCQREMRVAQVGVAVIEMAEFGPYKIWWADRMECPECGRDVVSRFADRPASQHFESGFKSQVNELRLQAENGKVELYEMR